MPKTLNLTADTIESETENGTHIRYVIIAEMDGVIIHIHQYAEEFYYSKGMSYTYDEKDSKLGEWWS